MKKGFYAYSSKPTFVKEVIEDSVKEINKAGLCKLMTWKSMNYKLSTIK